LISQNQQGFIDLLNAPEDGPAPAVGGGGGGAGGAGGAPGSGFQIQVTTDEKAVIDRVSHSLSSFFFSFLNVGH